MKLSFKSYVRYLRKQRVHIQHIHALTFSGIICFLLGVIILYYQYGFWHAEYVREEKVKKEDTTVLTESPVDAFSQLVKEGSKRFSETMSSFTPFMESETAFDREATTTFK